LPELRRDPVIGRWVIISTDRGRRPMDFESHSESHGKGPCPFCPGQEDKTPPEILAYHEPGREKNKSGWWIRVVPNKYPALTIEGEVDRKQKGLYNLMDGVGAHELIIETTHHNKEVPQLEMKQVEDIFWVYRDRLLDLKKDSRFKYVLLFKNHGAAAGASLSHPHSQLIATPMVPIRVKQEMSGAKSYYKHKQHCVFCDIVSQELKDKERLVVDNDDFLAITPFASRFPFEVWVIPKFHSSHFDKIEKTQVSHLASIMKTVLGKINGVLDNPPYNYLIHDSPFREKSLPHYHWHIEIMPKLTRVAGFEWGTGFYINPTPPEEAAKYLREIE